MPGIPETCPPGEGMLLFLLNAIGALLLAVPLPGPPCLPGARRRGPAARPHAPAPLAPGIEHSPRQRRCRRRPEQEGKV
jgi:hypothetical protein